jgi:hypothetical protein
MANVSDKLCREEQSTYLTLRNILSKIVQFVRKCGKKRGSIKATEENTAHPHCVLEN